MAAAIFTAALFAAVVDVRANAIYSGGISGTFSNPVLTGFGLGPNGGKIPIDNTNTAVFTGFGTNSISWGAPFPNFPPSTLTFTGKSFSGVAPGQVFDLGTITYFNGNSLRQTLIFGGTLTLAVDSIQGGPVDPATSNLRFIATANHLLKNGQPDPKFKLQDADFVTFNVFPQTFNVFEHSRASADLFGKIVGDPSLTITGIQIVPGQENNGFIGHGSPVPDSGGSFALMGFALMGLAVYGLSRRQTSRLM